MSNADDPAFPTTPENKTYEGTGGLTKREIFAAMALQGAMANPAIIHKAPMTVGEIRADFAESAVACADALLLALEKTT